MDPALLKEREAFKRRALEAATSSSHVQHKKDTQKRTYAQSKAKKSSKPVGRIQRPQPQPTTKCE